MEPRLSGETVMDTHLSHRTDHTIILLITTRVVMS
jgi:hypothetical protein